MELQKSIGGASPCMDVALFGIAADVLDTVVTYPATRCIHGSVGGSSQGHRNCCLLTCYFATLRVLPSCLTFLFICCDVSAVNCAAMFAARL